MLKISTSGLASSRFIYTKVTDCLGNLSKNILDYAVKHQYSLSLSIWSYFFIEVGRTAAVTTFGEDYVYNLDTCREALCNNYWNKTEKDPEFFYSPVVEFRCSEQGSFSYSFVECLSDLCKHIAIIGGNFYACIKNLEPTPFFTFNDTKQEAAPEIELSLPLIDYWNQICPKKEFRHSDKPATKLKELTYLTKCLETLCTPDNLIRFQVAREITSLCANKDIMKLYDLLHRISRSIKKLQKVTLEASGETTGAVISNIVVALATVVGGAATIAAAIITYRTSQTADILQNALPSLDEGVRTISKAAVETTRAVIRKTSVIEQMLSPEALQTLEELSSTLNSRSSSSASFHSAIDKLSPAREIRVRFDPNTKIINVVQGTLGIVTGGAIGIAGRVPGGNGVLEQPLIDQAIEKITSASFTIKEVLTSVEPTSLNPSNFNIRESLWFSYLKNTLLSWKDAYCFYEGIEKFIFCKFPRPPFQNYISFFLEDLKEFFSKNTAVLCRSFNEELWCNWNNFLELISITRNITFIGPHCDWDQFGLQIDKISMDTYSFKAWGTCYNETNLIKV